MSQQHNDLQHEQQLLQHLTRQYPQQDVPAELRRLQRD